MRLKKLVSLNPNRYKATELDALCELYLDYRKHFNNYDRTSQASTDLKPKTFTQWLNTEI